jgi:hypothetical protein
MKGYLYNKDNFYYAEITLQASPLEPGVFFDQANCTRTAPPVAKENEVPYWNGNAWEMKPDYSDKVYYNKTDRSEKRFEIGEAFDNNYTEKTPIENERFQKFQNNNWVVDSVEKNKNEKQMLITKATGLLASSDWTQTLDNQKNRGQEWVDKWAAYRVELRKVVNEERDTLPKEVA